MRLESALVAAGFWNPWTRCYGAGKDYVLPLRVVQQKASWQGRTGCSLQLKFCSCSHTPTDPCCCGGYHLFSPRPPPPFRPVFQGSGRGMLASESIGMVDIALEIPESLFISKELLGQSELAGLDEAELCGNIGFFINGFKHEGQDHDGQNHNLSCKLKRWISNRYASYITNQALQDWEETRMRAPWSCEAAPWSMLPWLGMGGDVVVPSGKR